MRQAAVLAFLSLWLTAGPVSAQTEAPAPYHLIRALQSEQDELVRGGGTPPAQGKLLAQIARAFEGTPIEAWRDPKNAAAAAIFLFSGGSSAAVRKLLATGAFAEADTPLLRGAAAYADGREGEARAPAADWARRDLPERRRAFGARPSDPHRSPRPAESDGAA